MASKNTSTNSRQAVQRSNSDSARWIAGLLLLFIGLFAAAAVFFSFFSWAADQSGLQKSVEERVTLGIEPENLCGWAGARLGRLLVDNSFGLFGLLIPVMIVLVGVRIIRQRPLLMNHSILSLFLIMIQGSLTLGFAFAGRWSLCCSTGWGGAFGIASSALLRTHIGAFGTLILLVGGWILTGVFINRNFINKVNEAGNVVVDKSGKVVEILKHKVVPHVRAAGEDEAAEPAAEPAPKPGPKAAAPQSAAPKAAEPAVQKAAPIHVERPAEAVAARKSAAEDDENPFLELTPDGKPVAGETAAEQTPPPAEDGEFIEVDLSRPEGRVVIGRSGLVELERPAVRDAVSAEPAPNPAPEEIPDGEAAPSDSDAPFTEIIVRDDAPDAEPEGVVVTVEANEAKLLDEKAIPTESYDPLKDLVNYRKPPVTLLEDYISDSEVSDEEIFENKTKIEETLRNFGIPIQRIKATVGPTVTLYEIVQAQGIKISKVQGLENDIAQSLKALGIRIIAPIPGKGTIGIEVPNRDKQVVSMYSAVRSLRFQESKAELPVVIGRTIQNENYVFDLAKMPHLLVAGATGQGKSVGLNAIITSLLYRKHPAQLKFVMIDPKMVEFSLYAKIERHFLAKMESEGSLRLLDSVVLLIYLVEGVGYLHLLCADRFALHRPATCGQQRYSVLVGFQLCTKRCTFSADRSIRLCRFRQQRCRADQHQPDRQHAHYDFPHRHLCRKNDHGIVPPAFASFYAYRRQKRTPPSISRKRSLYQSRFFFFSIHHAKKQPTTVMASGIHQTQSPGICPSPIFIPKKPNTIFGIVMMMVRMVKTFMMIFRLLETTEA